MNYNPYDLIPTKINGKDFQSRPIAFDSDVVDNQAMTNAFGNIVKPTRVSTICPDCGQGLEYDCDFKIPPFYLEVNCYHCNLAPPPPADPFVNPLDTGRIDDYELDPILHDPNEKIVGEDDGTTVADRFPMDALDPGQYLHEMSEPEVSEPEVSEPEVSEPEVSEPEVSEPEVSEPEEKPLEEALEVVTPPEPQDMPKVKEKPKKTPRKAKKSTSKVTREVPIEPVDGITEEIDIDDELAEDE
jgi:hypothetical protein